MRRYGFVSKNRPRRDESSSIGMRPGAVSCGRLAARPPGCGKPAVRRPLQPPPGDGAGPGQAGGSPTTRMYQSLSPTIDFCCSDSLKQPLGLHTINATRSCGQAEAGCLILIELRQRMQATP